jgi:PKD repeat protein
MFRRLPLLSFAALATLGVVSSACNDRSAPTAVKPAILRDVNDAEPGTLPPDFASRSVAASEQATRANASIASAALAGGLTSAYSATGKLALSVDGLGTNDPSGIVQVEKPAGATVKAAFLVAASTGGSARTLLAGDVKIDGVGFPWAISVASTIGSWNHWADVTSLVKPKIDAAPAGRVNFTITEVSTFGIDGEVLAVVFDDPSQATDNTIVLLFGAQNVAGDQFVVSLANPLDLSDPALVLNMGLGISFGFQPGGQFSEVNVNSVRLSSSAGGQDDAAGTVSNGTLLTVGGLDDATSNPPPFAAASTPRTDDELYDLKPFVANGDASITVTTRNPSNDDNIFFASFFLTVKASVIVNPPANQPPVANAGGPYTGAEGSSISFNGAGSTDPDGDALTYAWDFENDGIVDATTATASHTYADNGSYTAKLTVDDGKGGTNSKTVAVTVTNVAPTGTFANTAPVNEGTSFGLSLSGVVDPGSVDVATGLTFAFDCGTGAGYGGYGASSSATCATADDASRTVRGKVRDKDGGETEYTGTALVKNVAPSLGALGVPAAPLALQAGGTAVTITASFTDPGTLDTHTGTISCDGGTAGAVNASAVNGSGTASGVCTFTAAGVYTVSMTVSDDDGGSDTRTAVSYIVIYDATGGFVTGGGWIDSPPGAYPESAGLTGKATFGFVSKYQKGATVPTGNTEFQFHAGSLDFHSDTYQWLVISGAKAQYKGAGTIAGRSGTFAFLVTAVDGDLSGGGGVDKFRIKIWNAETNTVVYDNKLGQAETSDAATALGGGNISIKAK